VPTADVEKNLLDQITASITTLSASYDGKIEALRKEINSGGETKAAALQAELDKCYGPQITTLRDEQKRLTGIIATLEAKAAGGGGGGDAIERKTVAQRFTDADAYRKDFREGKGERRSIAAVEVKSFWPTAKEMRERKASINFDTTNYGSAVVPLYRDGILTSPKSMPIMRQLCEVIPAGANTNSVIMNREVAEHVIAAKLTALANSGATTVTVDNAVGFRAVAPFNQLTLNNGSESQVRTITNVNTTTGVITFTPASSIDMAAGDLVSAPGYGVTPEGLLAPMSFEQLERYTVNIARLATALKIELDVLSDVNQAEAFIQDRLLSRHGRNEDWNFLYGDGNTNKIMGLFNDTDVPSLAFSSGTLLDFLIDATYDLAYSDYETTGIIVSPYAHKKVVKTKGSDGHYIYLPSAADQAPDKVYAVPFKWSNQLISTQGALADWRVAAKILDREDASVEVGTEDDDFRRFRRTIIAAARVGFGIPLQGAARTLTGL
jgi:HK97 family phage major capsid protein